MAIHKEIEAQLSAYLDEELAPKESQDIEQHLAGCAECAGRLEDLRAASRALRALPGEEVPPHIAHRLSAAVSEEMAARRPAPSPGRNWLQTSPAFAAAALVIGIAVMFGLRALPVGKHIAAPPSAVETQAPEATTDAPAAGRDMLKAPQGSGGGATAAPPGAAESESSSPGSSGTQAAPTPSGLPEQRLFPPQVIVEREEYEGKLEDALDRLAGEPVVQEAVRFGSPGGEARRREVIEEMIALAEKQGADPASLERALVVRVPGAANIPLRAELIQHQARDVWLIVYIGASGTDGLATAAIDAQSGEPLSTGGMVP